MAPTNMKAPGAPIAVIGLSCRFPGEAETPSRFWDLLKSGQNAYSPTTDRYNAEAFYHPVGNGNRQNTIPKGGHFLKQDPYVFDAAFFNVTAAEAMALDPKQRIAMEVAYEALENAGLPLQRVAGSQTSCFMGSAMSDYREAVGRDFANYPKYHLLGTSEEMVSNRISHFLDIHGPSATIMTACSSSHVATHLACQSIQTGEADMAIAGGVTMILSPESTMHLNNLGFLNPKGQSRTFDAEAGGYGRGEGCGVLILKRLDKAVEDGDNIRAVIRASGSNSDGWTQGVTMPSGTAQEALIRRIYETNSLPYEGTQYVEAHGTGTKAGDPVETGAIYRTIGSASRSKSNQKLWVGSVKPNIGHLEAAAGVASLIKSILAMENGLIPPNVYFNTPSPDIPLDKWNMSVPTKLTPWPVCQTKRVSVSGFGMGGTNAHLVLESHQDSKTTNGAGTGCAPPAATQRLFTLSSHDKAGFKRLSKMLVEHLDGLGRAASNPVYLANLAHTLSTARSGLTWKETCITDSLAELREQLETVVGDNATRAPTSRPRLGFVFTGQGAQWARMGLELLDRSVFSHSVSQSTKFLKQFGCEWDPIEELSKPQKESRLVMPAISQPICTVLQIALVDELRAWGIVPSKVVGHSSGEIAAAYCMGALTHRDAMAAAYFRGKFSAGLKNRNGGMMAVGASREQAKKLIAEAKVSATVACVNSPSSVTISGDVDSLESLRGHCEQKSVFARRLKVDVAYHSSHMNSCSVDYANAISDLSPLEEEEDSARPIMVSSVTGREVDAESLGQYYWVQNLISPVLFADALKELVSPEDPEDDKNDVDLLIEVGPHSALGGPIEQILSHHGIQNVGYKSMLTRGQNAVDTTLTLAADLFRAGVPFEAAKVNGDLHCRLLTTLPPYPWNHSEKFRVDSRIHREHNAQKHPTRALIGAELPRMEETERVWRSMIRLNDEPWLRGHTVGATVLFPAAGMISLALEAAQDMADEGKQTHLFRLRDVSFVAAMALSSDEATEITVHMRQHLVATTGSTQATWWEFTVSSCIGASGQMRNNCRGLISIDYKDRKSAQMASEEASQVAASIAEYRRVSPECPKTCSKTGFYDKVARSAFRYEGAFQGIEELRPGVGQTVYDVKTADISETFTKGRSDQPFMIDAGTLDSIFQGYLGTTGSPQDPLSFGTDRTLLPTAVGELEISADFPRDPGRLVRALCKSRDSGFNERLSNITVFDEGVSKVLVSITDFRLSEVEMEGAGEDKQEVVDPSEITFETRWDHALDLLNPEDIHRVLAKSSLDGLVHLARLAIHQNPEMNVIEAALSSENLVTSVMSQLPQGMILPTQVGYALVNGARAQTNEDEKVFGQPFDLSMVKDGVPDNMSSAELLILPLEVTNSAQVDLEQTLERLLRLAKPSAQLLVATEGAPNRITKMLHDKAVLQTSSASGNQTISLYTVKGDEKINGSTNGHTRDEEAVLLVPASLSNKGQKYCEDLQKALGHSGYSVRAQSWADAIAAVDFQSKTYISLLELEQPFLPNLSESDFQAIRTLVITCERLLWITHGDNPSFGMSDGFLRVIRGEISSATFQVLHLTSDLVSSNAASLALKVLGTSDDEFREESGLLQVSRVYKSLAENEQVRNHLVDSTRVMSLLGSNKASKGPAAYRLTVGKPGLLDTLHFVNNEESRLVPLGDYEVELHVKATGVNFKDIMGSMGLVPVNGLGQEASGVVLRLGKEAARLLKPGDRVSTLTLGGTHATITRCDCRVTKKLADNMSFEDGAAVPVVYATAYYALVKLAKLRKGQSVLIHAAAGGVGQAAVQLANLLGLTAYVTVGSPDKVQLLIDQYGVPKENIFNSRDASFAKAIKRVTNGRGVDCILNSLSGELLRVSFECLATFGTFVEIGLRDISDNMRLDMRPFGKSTTFTFADLHTLLEQDPAAAGEILTEVQDMLRAGSLKPPHPLSVYPVEQVQDVFRTMQQGKHRGKMVLSFTEGRIMAPVLCKAKHSLKLDPEATYLFVGGLGGLGRSLAMEMVASGARHIAFVSRSGDSKPAAKAVVQDIEALGAEVRAYRADVGDEASLHAAMIRCEQELPPIKGVLQMAMVLEDVVFEKMSYEQWQSPIIPKVPGTWNLHTYFGADRPLDFMIFCSSTAGTCGNPSQAQYAAGNTYQDELARYLRYRGLKAAAVNLGIMRDVGILAEQGSHSLKAWEEVMGIREPAFHALMKSLINSQLGQRSEESSEGPVQVSIGLGTADLLAVHNLANPHYFKDPRFSPLRTTSFQIKAGAADGNAASLSSRLAGTQNDIAAAVAVITDALVKKTAEILRIPPSEVDPSLPMYHYGVDSLVALEVRNWITREMKANMALLEILAAVPMEKFAQSIAEKSKLVAIGTE